MNIRRSIIPLLLVFGFAICAQANTVQMQLVNVDPGNNDGSAYVYPYNFSINGSGSLISLLCDDYTDDVYFGETWTAKVNTFSDILLGGGQMVPSGGFVAAGQTAAAYMDAAWLYEELTADPTPTNAVNINHAIWGLFTATPFNTNADVTAWFAKASAATSTLTNEEASLIFDDVGFYTPVVGSQVPYSAGRPQEFIGTVTPPVRALIGEQISVAEPSNAVTLGAGLLALGSVIRRKKQVAARSL